jgi:hypothetical protein
MIQGRPDKFFKVLKRIPHLLNVIEDIAVSEFVEVGEVNVFKRTHVADHTPMGGFKRETVYDGELSCFPVQFLGAGTLTVC